MADLKGAILQAMQIEAESESSLLRTLQLSKGGRVIPVEADRATLASLGVNNYDTVVVSWKLLGGADGGGKKVDDDDEAALAD